MGKFIDLTGIRFGRLVVVKRDGTRVSAGGYKRAQWERICDCGKTTYATTLDLRKGDVRSCGCLKAERDRVFSATHHESDTRLYHIWQAMRKRCNNVNDSAYKNYGGRGITVCDEWNNSYLSFRDWSLIHGYNDKLSIDRINVNEGYYPDNCRWVDWGTQCNNRRNNIYIEHNGESHSIAEWARLTGVKYSTLYHRFKIGLQGDELFAPVA